jgi:hypothetical protein
MDLSVENETCNTQNLKNGNNLKKITKVETQKNSSVIMYLPNANANQKKLQLK